MEEKGWGSYNIRATTVTGSVFFLGEGKSASRCAEIVSQAKGVEGVIDARMSTGGKLLKLTFNPSCTNVEVFRLMKRLMELLAVTGSVSRFS